MCAIIHKSQMHMCMPKGVCMRINEIYASL